MGNEIFCLGMQAEEATHRKGAWGEKYLEFILFLPPMNLLLASPQWLNPESQGAGWRGLPPGPCSTEAGQGRLGAGVVGSCQWYLPSWQVVAEKHRN